MPVFCCFNHYSFVACFEIRCSDVSSLIPLCIMILWALLGQFVVPGEVLIFFPNSMKNVISVTIVYMNLQFALGSMGIFSMFQLISKEFLSFLCP